MWVHRSMNRRQVNQRGIRIKTECLDFKPFFSELRTGADISGARFHRAEHVENVLHVRVTTVIPAPALIWLRLASVPPKTANQDQPAGRRCRECAARSRLLF